MQALHDAAAIAGTDFIAVSVLDRERVPRTCVERWGREYDRSFLYQNDLLKFRGGHRLRDFSGAVI